MSYGGGGYDNYGGGGGYGSQSSQQSPSKSIARNTLRPVTIKQIIGASAHDDTNFIIDGAELGQITFVAQIRNVVDQATNSTYKMEDGTGSIEVKQYAATDKNRSEYEEAPAMVRDPALCENAYARVLGNLKQFNGKRHVGAHSVRPIKDFNEVQFHFLEVTAVHLYHTRGPPESQTAQMGGGGGAQTRGAYDTDTAMGGTGDAGGKGGKDAYVLPPGTSAAARKIYLALKGRSDSSEGIHVQMISQMTGIPTGETYKAVDELLTNGICFTTMDDEHIAVMDF